MTQIRADLNNARPDGRIRVNLRRADGDVIAGARVTLIDSSDPETTYDADVLDIEDNFATVRVVKSVGLNLASMLWGKPRIDHNRTQSAVTYGLKVPERV